MLAWRREVIGLRNILSRARLGTALRGSLYYTGAGGAGRFLFLVALPWVTRSVSLEVFGQYALIRVLLSVLESLAGLGVNSALVRHSAHADPSQRDALWSTAVWGRLGSGALMGCLLWSIGAPLTSVALGRSDGVSIAGLATATFVVAQVVAPLEAGLRARERHAVVAGAAWSAAVVRFGLILGFVVYASYGLAGLLLAHVLAESVNVVILVTAAGRAPWHAPRWNDYKQLVRFGAPVSLSFLVSALGALDRWLIRAANSVEAAGAYQLAGMPRAVVEVLEQATLLAFEPYIYGSEREHAGQRLVHLVGYFAWIALSICCVVSVLGPEVLALLAPPHYARALPVLPWLLFAGFADAMFRLVGMASGLALRTRPWGLASGVQFALLVALLIPLTLSWGALGAGIARFAAALVGMLLCDAFSRSVSDLRMPTYRATACLLLCVAAGSGLLHASLAARAAAAAVLIGLMFFALIPRGV